MAGRRSFRVRARQAFAVAGLLAAILVPVVPGLGGSSLASGADRGGCILSSASCYFFDVSLSGTGSGTYATLDADGQFTGRIVCHYGNEQETGICGWGYEVPAGGSFGVSYQLTPDKGSQACNTEHCYGGTITDAYTISGNYFDPSWRFELIDPIQIDVTIDGNGIGRVTSDPAGIDCASDCQDLFPARQPITLSARPQANYTFAGWSGGCTGTTSVCTINSSTAVAVNATFTRKATLPPATKPPAEETEALTDEVTPEPATAAPTDAPTLAPIDTAAAVPTIATATSTDVGPASTADPAPASSAGGSSLPIVILLVVVLLALVGGAVFALRRGGGLAGS
ncbi:MAG TPA: hypothetical protein VFI15_04865 [Candidatus Limnocylindrales bacterium]|nr:hypothetical protein [Candidatus Limnocylindrales bacterium]